MEAHFPSNGPILKVSRHQQTAITLIQHRTAKENNTHTYAESKNKNKKTNEAGLTVENAKKKYKTKIAKRRKK